jgi:hypothetical protein
MSQFAKWSAGPILASLLAAGIVLAGDSDKSDPFGKDKPSCSRHGTTIDFLEKPTEAAAQAKKEGKLVLVLHISGNFENPLFT